MSGICPGQAEHRFRRIYSVQIPVFHECGERRIFLEDGLHLNSAHVDWCGITFVFDRSPGEIAGLRGKGFRIGMFLTGRRF